MQNKQIKITIDKLGNPQVEALGFNGVGCKNATELLEKALAAGDGGVSTEYKSEWSNQEESTEIHLEERW
jgi:hypothetical protein